MREREVPGWLAGPLVAGAFFGLVWLEERRPLRPLTQPKRRRDARNLAVAALSALTLRFVEKPVVLPLARRAARRRRGLARLPLALELPLAVVLLDYTLYVWHVLTHRVPFLWRFHRVHHADVDLTTTTALRFHFAEMALSVPWRAAQVTLLGVSPLALTTWQTLTCLAILFHHSDVAIPERVEARLARWIMTPRLHGVHHSVERDEADSNWATILVWPDRVHGTGRDDVAQEDLEIGIPDVREEPRLGLVELLALPFTSPAESSPVEARGRA